MQAYDLIMLVVLGAATILGAIKGFAWQVASLASIFASYLVAVNFRFDLAKMIQATPPWNVFLAMLILYVGTSFVIWVAFRLLSGLIDQVRLKEFDRHLGALFGLAKGGMYCLLITMFAMTLLGPKQQEAICRSQSGYYIASALDNAGGVLPKELHDVVGPYLDRLDDKLHQQFPAGDPNNPSSPAGGLWPSSWAGGTSGGPANGAGGFDLGGAIQSGLGIGPAGTGPAASGGGSAGVGPSGMGVGQEQGSGGGFNFWPSGAPPQAAPQAPTPQNYPPLLPPPPGSFGYDPSALAPNNNWQQAQLPNGNANWPR
ncbi:MAG: CvpA family protein [Pirellulaceae bacterium]|nr:CvpA family protein [Pirellulaceae bacterium]